MTTKLDDAALGKLLDLGFDFVCTRRVSELVDAKLVLSVIDDTVTEPRVRDIHMRVSAPIRDRLLERAKASSVLLGAWLPAEAKDTIATLLGRPARIPQKLIDEAVASDGVRDQIREALRDAITGFIKNAGGGSAPASALRGAFGIGARAFGAAGKAVLGGLGDELQKQMQDRVKDFVDGAVGGVQERIVQMLTDPKTAEQLGKRRRKAFLKMLERTEGEAAALIAHGPMPEIDALIAPILVHNVKRQEVREAIRAEVEAAVTELSKETIGALLDQVGAREVARRALHSQALPLLREAVRTPEFVAWWNAHH
ncbi:MAG: hypothetical protein HYV09_14315 [Deltaproteobacteria bacterium]|nr:hypothetical protein [Deltaproteobacteria bacterium]